jgi:hypothetical protein
MPLLGYPLLPTSGWSRFGVERSEKISSVATLFPMVGLPGARAGRVHINLEDDQVSVGASRTRSCAGAPPCDSFSLRGGPRAPSVVFFMGAEDVPCLRL